MAFKSIASMAFAAALLIGPAHAQICTPFTDVAASNPFCGDIQWMLNRGITSGCGTNLFCPNDVMPREQMAAFMKRLADKVTFQQGGNAFGAAGELGTTDNQVLEVIVNNSRVMRYEPNGISPNVIGGSPANSVTAGVRGATIAGGGVPVGDIDPDFNTEAPNRVTDAYGTVAGGYANVAGNDTGSTTDAPWATVGGGVVNAASALYSTVAGGVANLASGGASTVAGGGGNIASGESSTVAGGSSNTASGGGSMVAGGYNNTASGVYSFVPGGSNNSAAGEHSLAAGLRAKAIHPRSFVWGGSATVETLSQAAGDFVVYAPTAVRMYAGPLGSGGCILSSGASGWVCASDRALKSDITAVDGRDVLARVAALPIARWSFASVPGVRHMGPMAQDFHEAFGLGNDATRLAPMDVQGVALAAIQGLNAKVEAQRSEIETQRREIADLKQAVGMLLQAASGGDDRIAVRAP